MINPVHLRILSPAQKYLRGLSSHDYATCLEEVAALVAREATVRTKQLRGPIREIIIGPYRFTYFIARNTLYIVRGFRKKTRKTPAAEIEYAEYIYSLLK